MSAEGEAVHRTRLTEDKTKIVKNSVAFDKYTFNDTGFTWLDITREKIHMRFHDSSGKIIYEYFKKK